MKRLGAVLIAIALVLYVAACGALYAAQRSMLFYPTPESQSSHARVLQVPTIDGGTLKVWYIRGDGERAVIYFGGNSEDVAGNIDRFRVALQGADIYIVNYRGYGGSTGTPSEDGLLRDAESVFDLVRSDHPRVAVIGRSLGSGVAVHLASVRDVEKLVLLTPYDSIARVAQRHFAIFPIAWLMKDRFDSFSKARRVRAPVLVLLAETDRIIPRVHSERLIGAFAPGQVEVVDIAGTNHDTIASAPEYPAALAAFLL